MLSGRDSGGDPAQPLGRDVAGTARAGSLLIVLGAVIFELSMLDMHIFRLFTIDSANVWG